MANNDAAPRLADAISAVAADMWPDAFRDDVSASKADVIASSEEAGGLGAMTFEGGLGGFGAEGMAGPETASAVAGVAEGPKRCIPKIVEATTPNGMANGVTEASIGAYVETATKTVVATVPNRARCREDVCILTFQG